MISLAVMIAGTHRLLGPDLRRLLDFVKMAEGVGFDEFLLGDHVVMGSRLDRYPYGAFGYGDTLPPISPAEPWPEVLTTLAAVSAVTQRIRLAPGVLLAPLRPAPLLAKTLATLDNLSAGRLSVGVGIGWQREEYAALGLPYADAWSRADDTIAACRTLWSDTPASLSSPSVSFTDIYCSPKPVQTRIPICFGGRCTPRMADRITRLGDGWFPLTNDVAEIRAGVHLIQERYVAAGRQDAPTIRASTPLVVHQGRPDLDLAIRGVPALMEAGVTSLWCAVTPSLGPSTIADLERVLAEFVTTLRMATSADARHP